VNPVNILEVGFGTGLNALLTAVRNNQEKREVFYTAIEKYILPDELVNTLNYHEFAGQDGKKIYEALHRADWNVSVDISETFHLAKVNCDLKDFKHEARFDLIYFDAFGPDKQPEMWENNIIRKIADLTVPGGIFVTYSAKGSLQRNLKDSGFTVSLLPGPPGKREVLRAVRIL
jgi:tRNA U34 5-methylaminomethyl-2-thiouridine-forming methyltransferase MnmC